MNISVNHSDFFRANLLWRNGLSIQRLGAYWRPAHSGRQGMCTNPRSPCATLLGSSWLMGWAAVAFRRTLIPNAHAGATRRTLSGSGLLLCQWKVADCRNFTSTLPAIFRTQATALESIHAQISASLGCSCGCCCSGHPGSSLQSRRPSPKIQAPTPDVEGYGDGVARRRWQAVEECGCGVSSCHGR